MSITVEYVIKSREPEVIVRAIRSMVEERLKQRREMVGRHHHKRDDKAAAAQVRELEDLLEAMDDIVLPSKPMGGSRHDL